MKKTGTLIATLALLTLYAVAMPAQADQEQRFECEDEVDGVGDLEAELSVDEDGSRSLDIEGRFDSRHDGSASIQIDGASHNVQVEDGEYELELDGNTDIPSNQPHIQVTFEGDTLSCTPVQR